MTASPAFLLFIVFLVLKLTGIIAWSWVWVTAPLWIGLAIFGVAMVAMFIFALLVAVFGK